MTGEEVAKAVQTNTQTGLAPTEAEQRMESCGPNSLLKRETLSPWRLFFSEFTDFMVLVLLGAVIVSGALGEWEDAVTILAIVFINAVLGFLQEFRAERALEALKELSAPQARVVRGGRVRVIPATQVVPGDILCIEAGDRVAADARLIDGTGLEADESPLTGESIPVEKDILPLGGAELGLGDRRNLVYAGTTITRGRGRGIIIATGMKTELGMIAGLLESSESGPTPLQRRLDQLGKILVLICIIVCLLVGFLGLWRGESFRFVFLSAVSLAVAAIPEGLPAIVTISLAMGVQRMIRRKVIIRHLPAVETLGCANVVCSDKTGTLTQNQMTVTRVILNGDELTVTGKGFSTEGDFQWKDRIINLTGNRRMNTNIKGGLVYRDPEGLQRLLLTGLYCNNSRLEAEKTGAKCRVVGDPTEGSLLVLASKGGVQRGKGKRVGEIPFTSERKRMSVLVAEDKKDSEGKNLYVKGAADLILELSTSIRWEGRIEPLRPYHQKLMRQAVEGLAKQALRVLALAYKPWNNTGKLTEDEENGLIFLGLVGMMDPPRPEIKEAVAVCKEAGIRTVMITGDFPTTARAIGKELGLLRPGGLTLTGKDLDHMSASELSNIVEQVDVFARVNPHHKLEVVRAFKNRGAVVAMTGDGVNDAPAVKEADIGVAMGISGTDVTKEASDMVIADDNFATIVAAVEEGRGIYSNIRKFIRYLLGCNIGEILTMFLASLAGMPIPLLPIQILWTNLVTDGLPAVALGVEPTEKELMNQSPRPPDEGVFSRGLGWKILFQGITIGIMTVTLFFLAMWLGADLREARTIAFSSLVFSQLSYVFACRSETRALRKISAWENPFLLGAVFISALMQLFVIYTPVLQSIFQTSALTMRGWLLVFASAVTSVLMAETVRWCGRILKRVVRH